MLCLIQHAVQQFKRAAACVQRLAVRNSLVCAEISRLGGLAALIRLLSHDDGACRCAANSIGVLCPHQCDALWNAAYSGCGCRCMLVTSLMECHAQITNVPMRPTIRFGFQVPTPHSGHLTNQLCSICGDSLRC